MKSVPSAALAEVQNLTVIGGIINSLVTSPGIK